MIDIPDYVLRIIKKLENHGYEAFLVGGCLRDIMLGKEPTDFDITTNALPDNIEEMFSDFRTVNIGKEFGTIIVVQEEGNIEITTYRIESEYRDGRRPSKVLFSNNIIEDLSRRDFTINSMAYNKNIGIIDPYNGREDLDEKIIRSVGNPKLRFKEDHLRILRGIRFATELEFQIEEETFQAMKEESQSLKNISIERIYNEFIKILLSNIPSRGINLMLDMGILNLIIPELFLTVDFNQHSPYHDK
ncbi:MAG: CCA tRNA nucleotidyltransferase, partial [Tissierellia bacterium]|nr:CCA tRNA nucleotidyltransferase [Tissierellia bacterium]